MIKTDFNKFYFSVITGIIFFIFFFSSNVEALPYRSYTYDYWGEAVPSPPPYLPSRVVDGSSLGVGELNEPRDLYVCESTEEIFLLDS